MRSKNILKSGLILLAVGVPVMAGDPPEDFTQQGMNQQSYADFVKSDQKLNAVYKKVLANQIDDKGKALLRKSERLWVQFRDAESASEADENRGGSIMPLVYNTWAKRLTDERTQQLQDRADSPAGE